MQQDTARNVLLYLKGIPEMIRSLREEKRALEAEFYGMNSQEQDGQPHGHNPGKPVEAMVIRAEESGAAARLQEIARTEQELEADRRTIQAALDGVNCRYKAVLKSHFMNGYSWARIGIEKDVPESTIRSWASRGLERMMEALQGTAEPAEFEGICLRASRARV